MRGVIYNNSSGQPTLLFFEGKEAHKASISDDDRLYETLPPEHGEIVEGDHNEVIGLFNLKSICCLSLRRETDTFANFWEGVDAVLRDHPEMLAELIEAGPGH